MLENSRLDQPLDWKMNRQGNIRKVLAYIDKSRAAHQFKKPIRTREVAIALRRKCYLRIIEGYRHTTNTKITDLKNIKPQLLLFIYRFLPGQTRKRNSMQHPLENQICLMPLHVRMPC
jgi:hypothetical protein